MKTIKTAHWLICAILVIVAAGCGVKRSQSSYDYESKVLSANYDGTYAIRVFVRARNAAIAFTDGQRKAVEEVIFKGVAAGSNGVSRLEPLCYDMNARAKNEDYFNAFFQDGGEWTKYASLKDKRTGTTHYQRNGKQMLEDVTVSVDRANLQKKLQEDGIIPQQNLYQL